MPCSHTHQEPHIKPLHCPCCGDRVIDHTGQKYVPRPEMREVRFMLTDGTNYYQTGPQPMCAACATEPWTAGRLAHMKRLFDDVCEQSDRGKEYRLDEKANTWSLVTALRPMTVSAPSKPKTTPAAVVKSLRLTHPELVGSPEPIEAIL